MNYEDLLNNLTVEEKKKYIHNSKTLKIPPDIISDLIISIRNIEFTEECFKNREKLQLSSCDIIKIISDLNDKNFVKRCIKLHRNFGLESEHIIGLFEKINNPIFTKECLYDEEILCNLDSRCIERLIELCRDDDFTKQCINEKEKWGLTKKDIRWLIIHMDDQEYTKDAIMNYEKFGFETIDLKCLVNSVEDSKFFKQCIKDREIYGWNADVISCMISGTDEKYIKYCIENSEQCGIGSEQIMDLITLLYEPSYTRECIKNKNLVFSPSETAALILSMDDMDYTKKCIKQGKFNFDSNELAMLISSIKDDDYTKECIIDAKKIGLQGNGLLFLIESICDNNFSKECILKSRKIGLDSMPLLNLLLSIESDEYIKQCLVNKKLLQLDDFCVEVLEKKLQRDNFFESNVLNDLLKQYGNIDDYIDLPQEMTIGIEIESEGEISYALNKLSNKIINDWICKPDGSLKYGIEIVSPILDTEKSSTEQIYKMCLFLNKYKQKVTNRCGGHIHIGSNYLKDVKAMQNLVDLWTNCENIIFIISNEEGDIPRNDSIEFAEPISKKVQTALDRGSVNLRDENDLRQFVKDLKYVQGNRYSSINFMNLDSEKYLPNKKDIGKYQDKNTIEFRLSNSTLNPNVWVQNINLYGGIVKTAQDLYEISQKNLDEITESDKIKLELFEKIKDIDTNEQEKLDALLKLAIPQEKIDIYIKRYEVNKKIIEQNEDLLKQIKSRTSNKQINTSKNQILRKNTVQKNQLNSHNEESEHSVIKSNIELDEFEI